MSVPKIIFIVPYRDRKEHLQLFKSHMSELLEDYSKDTYKILFIHQCDERSFNRGCMKNIGFKFVKDNYPTTYQNITLVFNDVDTYPRTKDLINYETTEGNIKHFFGFKYALGGIVSIKAKDFEKMNGFPNLWAWGYEDNALQQRALESKLNIDRSQFFLGKDENIIQIKDGPVRVVNKIEFEKYMKKINDGIHSITNLEYIYDEKSGFVNVNNFHIPHSHANHYDKQYDLRHGLAPFSRGRRNPLMNMPYIG
tara:strand:- start:10264 stop:11022 length:759 start_codon:yes stop_codon:yes gene_type:complete